MAGSQADVLSAATAANALAPHRQTHPRWRTRFGGPLRRRHSGASQRRCAREPAARRAARGAAPFRIPLFPSHELFPRCRAGVEPVSRRLRTTVSNVLRWYGGLRLYDTPFESVARGVAVCVYRFPRSGRPGRLSELAQTARPGKTAQTARSGKLLPQPKPSVVLHWSSHPRFPASVRVISHPKLGFSWVVFTPN